MTSETDGREFSRSAVDVKSLIRLESGVLVEGYIQDVSMNGVLFKAGNLLPIGTRVNVTLILEGGQGEINIESHGTVRRLDEGVMAIQFTNVNAGSVEHLRRLVLYNAIDPDQVDREFQQHVGLKSKAAD
jgi:hypothetical protein